MALRIIAGELKGRKLLTVRGFKIRPTANRTREAIFNILAHHIPGSRVLDLFAGSGAFGIEALSRKGDLAVFIDNDRDCLATLRSNLLNFRLQDRARIIRWDLTNNLDCLASLQMTFDLVFMDPPYQKHMIEPALENLHLSQCLATGTRVVVEHSRRELFSTDRLPFEAADQRKYGKTLVTFLDYVV